MFLQCRLYFCLTLLASPFDWHFWPCIFDQLSLFYLGITCPNTSCIYIQKRSGKEDTTAVFYVFFPWQQHALAIMKFQYTAKLVTPIQEKKVLYSSYFSGIQKCILCFLLLYSCSTAMPTYSEALIVSRFMWLSKSVLLFGKELGPRQFCAIYYHAFTFKVKGQFCGNKASESFPPDLSKCAKMRGSNW